MATIEIKGKEYTLIPLNLNDFVEIEESFAGKELDAVLKTMKGTRYVLWLAVRKNHPELKVEDMGALIDLQNMDKIKEILDKLGGETPKNPPRAKAKK